jgi:hypothetical protein
LVPNDTLRHLTMEQLDCSATARSDRCSIHPFRHEFVHLVSNLLHEATSPRDFRPGPGSNWDRVLSSACLLPALDVNQTSERIGLQLKRLQCTIDHTDDWCFTTGKKLFNVDSLPRSDEIHLPRCTWATSLVAPIFRCSHCQRAIQRSVAKRRCSGTTEHLHPEWSNVQLIAKL